MKKLITIISIIAITLQMSFSSYAQSLTLPPSGGNQKSIVKQYIGSLVSVKVAYNSPDVHASDGTDRTGAIWGQLIPYGLTDLGFGLRNPSPWRAGANQNTTITFSHDVQVEGKPLKAGTYGLHMIVEENAPWTLVLSKNSSAWGSYFYEEKDDALRVQVTPEDHAFTEWLNYSFVDRQPTSSILQLEWENKAVPFKIEVPNMNELYVANFRKELQGATGFSWQNWNQAANFCLTNDINLNEALTWAEASISAPFVGQKNFTTLSTKASIQYKLDQKEEAKATMQEAINNPTATALLVHSYGRQLIAEKRLDEALKVFQDNRKKYKSVWPTNYGLARVYSARGDFKNALKYLKIAKTKVPEGDTINASAVDANIKKLENGQDIN